jgi:hypothetical protein
MKIRKYVLAAAITILTFAFGVSVYTGVRMVASVLSSLAGREDVVAQQTVEPVQAEPLVKMKEIVPAVIGLEEDNAEMPYGEPGHEFNGSGEYWMIDELKPEGFEDIESLEIIMRNYANDHPYGLPIPPKGSLQTKKTFKFKRIAVGGKEIAFQTEEVDGISYKFTGRFLDEEILEGDEFPSDLAGRLIKFKDGVWIASMHAKFYTSHC